jgi:hypothetical protein
VESSSETLTIEEIVEINRQQIEGFGGLFLPFGNFHNRSSLEYALDILDAELFGTLLYPLVQMHLKNFVRQIVKITNNKLIIRAPYRLQA